MGFVKKFDLLILWHCGTVEPDNTSRPTDGGEEEAMSVQLSGTTTMLGLIGTPVAHSKSPAMYNHCFARYGLDWAYLAFDVTQEKAGAAVQTLQTITQAAPECTLSLHDLDDGDDLRRAVSRCDILSNATRVGMAPEVEHSIITDRSWFQPELVVTDVVYAPPETKLLRDARSAGCRTCDGLGMLLCQGAEAFRLYSGLEMPIEEIWTLLYT